MKSHVSRCAGHAEPPDIRRLPVVPATAVIRTAVHAATSTDKPIRVVEGGRLLGVVDRADILTAIAGAEGE